MRRYIAALVMIGLSVVACSSDGPEPTSQPSAVATSGAPTPAPTPCVIDGADTRAKEQSNDRSVSLLTDVRPSDEGCASVVFEFRDHIPGYRVDYVEPPLTECGSGDDVPVGEWGAGAYLSVRMEPSASADLTHEDAPMTYDGPRDFDIDGQTLIRVRKTCDFEAVMEWIVALDAERPFKVESFESPARLVISATGG